MKNLFVFLFVPAFLASCTTVKVVEKVVVQHDTIYVTKQDKKYMQLAVAWYQTSGEFRALCYQAFNTAKIHVDSETSKNNGTVKRAIVVDIDETMLDNSPYEAANVLNNFGYPEKWSAWTLSAKAKAIPGAVDFMNYAVSKGIDVFYISNRKEEERKATVENLKALGFPQADDAHLLLRTTTSNKEDRRKKVMETHQIIMLVGDNLNDFNNSFEKKNIEEKFKLVDQSQTDFGIKYIVLPNPMYGDWEGSIYKFNFNYTEQQKDSLRNSVLNGF